MNYAKNILLSLLPFFMGLLFCMVFIVAICQGQTFDPHYNIEPYSDMTTPQREASMGGNYVKVDSVPSMYSHSRGFYYKSDTIKLNPIYLHKNESNCGEWVYQETQFFPWSAIDTLFEVTTDKRDWYHDEIKPLFDNSLTHLVHYPCGKNPSASYTQKRICKITGIIEERLIIERYRYEPKEKNMFDQIKDQFKQK